MSLTLSTIDTLINSISSLIIVDGNQINKSLSGKEIKSKTNSIILLLSIIVFILASKGYSILYLFLLADLLCCAFVVAVFYSFYNKLLNEKIAYFSIIMGLILGLLFFPAPDFSKSLLVGIIVPMEIFPVFISQSLLFLSFLIATLVPAIVIMTNDSIKRR